MTFLEALAELGLEPTDDSRAARRAYLRLLKERSPERDPEGFKRLRQAYEVAAGGLDQIQEAIRPADSDGAAAFGAEPGIDLSAVAERYRLRLSAYEYESLIRTRSMVHAMNIVHRLIEQGQPDIACVLGCVLIEQARFDREPRLPIELVIRQICRMQARGASVEARRFADALTVWLERSGREVELLSTSAAKLWLLTKELCALPDGIRPEAMRALVTFVLEEDHSLAERLLASFVERHPKEADELEAMLRESAPSIHHLFDWPHPRFSAARSLRKHWPWWLLAGGLLLAILLFLLSLRGTHCHNYLPPGLP